MRHIIVALFAVAMAPATANAASGYLPHHDAREPPVGGDCAAVASKVGAEATWYGEFAGNYYDDFWDQRYPFSLRGCFPSEYTCRVWQHEAISYAGRGGIVYMRCRQGVESSY